MSTCLVFSLCVSCYWVCLRCVIGHLGLCFSLKPSRSRGFISWSPISNIQLWLRFIQLWFSGFEITKCLCSQEGVPFMCTRRTFSGCPACPLSGNGELSRLCVTVSDCVPSLCVSPLLCWTGVSGGLPTILCGPTWMEYLYWPLKKEGLLKLCENQLCSPPSLC